MGPRASEDGLGTCPKGAAVSTSRYLSYTTRCRCIALSTAGKAEPDVDAIICPGAYDQSNTEGRRSRVGLTPHDWLPPNRQPPQWAFTRQPGWKYTSTTHACVHSLRARLQVQTHAFHRKMHSCKPKKRKVLRSRRRALGLDGSVATPTVQLRNHAYRPLSDRVSNGLQDSTSKRTASSWSVPG